MDEIYEPYYIFIERNDDFYNEVGRYETLEQAKEIDNAIKGLMKTCNIDFCSISCLSPEMIVKHLTEVLGDPSERI